MNTISYTEARSSFAKTMEKVCKDHDPIIVTRQNAGSIVMMSLEDYNALEETAYLLKSPKNAARLMRSLKSIKAGKAKKRNLAK